MSSRLIQVFCNRSVKIENMVILEAIENLATSLVIAH
jgi:hypothetical protein